MAESLTLEYDENGNLQFKTEALEADGRLMRSEVTLEDQRDPAQ